VTGVRVTTELVPIDVVSVSSGVLVEQEPDIVFNGTHYLMVWAEGVFGGESKVYTGRVDPNGVVIDSGVPFGMGAHEERKPVVAFDGDRHLAIWYNYGVGPYGVWGRFISNDALPEGREFAVRSLEVNTMCDPGCAYGDPFYLVVWNEPDSQYIYNIYGQLVAVNGDLVGSVIPIAVDSINQFSPEISVSERMFIVVWEQNQRVFGQWVSFEGELVGEHVEISDPGVYNRTLPDVGVGGTAYCVVWQEYHTDNCDIYGNVAALPAAVEAHNNTNTVGQTGTICLYEHIANIVGDGKLYDVSGRCIQRTEIMTGIYFVHKDTAFHKIIVIRN
jgi:hypothetical protein